MPPNYLLTNPNDWIVEHSKIEEEKWGNPIIFLF